MSMTNNTATLTTRQQQCISGLLAGLSHNAAARDAGISIRTLSRWLNDKTFAAKLARQRGELTAQLQSLVMARATSSVETLSLMSQSVSRDADKIRAAAHILRFALGAVSDAEQAAEFAWLTA
jgi:transcriptional regulator with XRE-family HTH domain